MAQEQEEPRDGKAQEEEEALHNDEDACRDPGTQKQPRQIHILVSKGTEGGERGEFWARGGGGAAPVAMRD
jgi:hypothetical protein